MRATLALTSLLPLLLLATPAAAATPAEKMETCKFGAEHNNLDGAKRDAFIKKCMANANYEPAARKEAMKKTPAAARKPANPAADAEPEE
ncbi:MAG: PsiF family protein [Hyphomicrobiales bacterium]|nr:PsiF family protein [Hyphomicrobiales bacterium]